jgi:hypothetical protein
MEKIMKNKNILVVRNLIKCLGIECLRREEVIANLVRAFGIVQWGPPVFGEDNKFMNPLVEMAGIYQTPIQIASALRYLSYFQISSYCEIGVFQGGNFLFVSDYLSKFNPEIVCTGVDPTNYLNDEIKSIISNEDRYHFEAKTSENMVGRKFSLCMIDAEHAYEWVKKDWNNLGSYADICMFHDINDETCPGPQRLWKELKKQYPERKVVEFLQHTSDKPTHGIGVIHNV